MIHMALRRWSSTSLAFGLPLLGLVPDLTPGFAGRPVVMYHGIETDPVTQEQDVRIRMSLTSSSTTTTWIPLCC